MTEPEPEIVETEDPFAYPVCLTCYRGEPLTRRPTGGMDGPAPERQRAGVRSERCAVCGGGTIAGFYLATSPVRRR